MKLNAGRGLGVAGAVSTGAGEEKSVSSSSRSWKRFWEAKREETALRGVFGGFDVSRRRLCQVVLMGLGGGGGVEKQKARETWRPKGKTRIQANGNNGRGEERMQQYRERESFYGPQTS